MNLLDGSRFTKRSDIANSKDGWSVLPGGIINTLNGNDSIGGFNGKERGIFNLGTINTGGGDDAITGIGIFYGIDNYFGTINTGGGNDSIIGEGQDSIGIRVESGTINSGAGTNAITGKGGFVGIWIESGTIKTGDGNDSITGTGTNKLRLGSYGISIKPGTLDTGAGNDAITGRGSDFGIRIESGTIKTGDGNDSITGSALRSGILNFGTINTGAGDDTVTALDGGFGGTGKTDLGIGNDTLKGFGSGKFIGGDGKDKIVFGQGSFIISGGLINGRMSVTSFENIGGANGGLFPFGNGTLTVNFSGVATSFV